MKLRTKALLFAGIPLLVFGAMGFGLIMQGDVATGRQVVAIGIIVAAMLGGALLYWREDWSLLKRSAVHFALMVVTVLPALILSGWLPLQTALDWVVLIGGFIAGGAVLWLVMYAIFGRKPVSAK